MKRRNFLKTTASGAIGYFLLAGCQSASKKTSANDKPNIALIGAGGRGAAHANDLFTCSYVNAVALCDVDDVQAAKTYRKAPHLPKFADYRVMLDKMDKQIDAVIIATPDHTHYPIASWAMTMGKHVYLEKPMTRTIWESRKLRDLAEKTGLITQLGNQGHGMGWWRDVAEWYKAGLIGEVVEMYNWTDRPIWNQGPYTVPDGSEKVPDTLDYNLWLNVAPVTPYSKKITPFHWRGFRNYGVGAMGDHACHSFDWFYSALDLGLPTKIKTISSQYTDFGWPAKTTTEFEFAPKGKRPAVKLYWSDGNVRPKEVKRLSQEEIAKMPNSGAIVGTKETVICYDQYGSGTRLSPRNRMIELKKANAFPAKTLPRLNKSHLRNFFDCVISGKRAESDIASYASKLNEFVLLGALSAFFSGQELHYDEKQGKITNVAEANEFFMSRYPYRKEFIISKDLAM